MAGFIDEINVQFSDKLLFFKEKAVEIEELNLIGSLTYLASFVTASARGYLSRLLIIGKNLERESKYKEVHVAYVDTDSIVGSQKFMHEMNRLGYVDKIELGKLKSELPDNVSNCRFRALAPKIYICLYELNGEE